MEIDKLVESNPWWTTKEVPEELKGKPRSKYEILIKSLKIPEVTIITGVRRSGKSTFMYQMVDTLLKNNVSPEHILFVNLEDKKLASNTLDDIYSAYREKMNPKGPAHIFLDEIHKQEKWETWIRTHYDRRSDSKFVISGSCSYLLKKEYSTLMTGRNLTFEVFPLSFSEFLDFKGINPDLKNIKKGIILEKDKYTIKNTLDEYLYYGGFPAVFFRDREFKMRLLSQYFDDILYKDIIDRYDLNSKKAKDLALYLMTNFTGLISLRNIRNALGLSYDLINDYISYYLEAFMFFTCDHFSYSMKEQKTKPSKVYCIDTGLRNAVSFKFRKDQGKLAENLAFVELKRREKDVYYWSGKGEVDFIIKNKDQSLSAINITYTNEIDDREKAGLLEFREQDDFKKIRELVLLTKDLEKKEDGIKFVPFWKWLLEGS